MAGRRKRPLSEAERKKRRSKIKREYWTKHGARVNKSRRDRAATDPEYRERRNAQGRGAPKRWLQRSYGISPEEYDAMVEAQNGLCLICQERPERGLCVDHCHERFKVRGLLCNNCNVGLGHFNDDPVRLLRAASYLLSFEAKVGARGARRKAVDKALVTLGELIAQLSPRRRNGGANRRPASPSHP